MEQTERVFSPKEGLGLGVFNNKYALRDASGTYSTWKERLTDVCAGNIELARGGNIDYCLLDDEQKDLTRLAVAGVIPFSGRHLQHGGIGQREKNGEFFTNCSTAMTSFISFYLLMKGSGVGRCYDNDICLVNWDYCPNIRCVLSNNHPDYSNNLESLEEAKDKYPSNQDKYRWFTVDDSAEGWMKVVEILETASFQQSHSDKLFIFDFSNVRPSGTPIKGQQGRPASGPTSFMSALHKVVSVKGSGMQPWKQSMWVDHYLADCVLLGGVRRSARIAVKHWRDSDIFDFINIKRSGALWSANDSVAVDDDFWEEVKDPRTHAYRVYTNTVGAQYLDQTGEPGFIYVSNLTPEPEGDDTRHVGIEDLSLMSLKYRELLSRSRVSQLDLHDKTLDMMDLLYQKVLKKTYHYITNPCGEICLAIYGAYCVIGEVNLALVSSLEEAIRAAVLLRNALIRVNVYHEFLYDFEVKRTNRIGVGLTGIHEWLCKHHNTNLLEIINNPEVAARVGSDLAAIRDAVEQDTSWTLYTSNRPFTFTTLKPSGTISKVLGVTEAGHAPAYDYYTRWVIMHPEDPDLARYINSGYPHRLLKKYAAGQYIVGFPTRHDILNYTDKPVLAGDLSIEEHFKWLMFLEEHWIGDDGNQVSYTIKYDPKKYTFEEYSSAILEYAKKVKCFSIMPQEDTSAYEYLPEEAITEEDYHEILSMITPLDADRYNDEHLMCSSGGCPIEFDR